MRNLNDIIDLSTEEIEGLIKTALDIETSPQKYADKCKGKKLATLFFEPSTRTRLSFEGAMYELGGNVLGFSSSDSSSTTKGESVTDTVVVVSNYADIIVMRHPFAGAPAVAMQKANVPIINAGDGGHFHPTQTLADIYTIFKEKGRLNNLKIGICGDLKFGRTVHSLIFAMSRYSNIEFILISPDELRLPDYMVEELNKSNVKWSEVRSLENSMKDLDILYMTRIQKERFDKKEEYEKLKNIYILDEEKLKFANENMSILHPLPRVNEISVDVDNDRRACYFRQTANGKYMRMALILMLLDEKNKNGKYRQLGMEYDKIRCSNPRCIINNMDKVMQIVKFSEADNRQRCAYCDSLL